ncbi:hypothetical protein Ancab_004722, partial [Ancistrocladus abbreviatus]
MGLYKIRVNLARYARNTLKEPEDTWRVPSQNILQKTKVEQRMPENAKIFATKFTSGNKSFAE